MITHFRLRPASPTPTSPTRPSTLYSTIRAVTPSPSPSPSIEMLRPKTVHALSSPSLTTVTSYVVKIENGEFVNTPSPNQLYNGVASAPLSPVNSQSKSLIKRSNTTPERPDVSAKSSTRTDDAIVSAQGERHGNVDDNNNDDDDQQSPPYTPTPMSREQKRHAYTPLRTPDRLTPTLPALPVNTTPLSYSVSVAAMVPLCKPVATLDPEPRTSDNTNRISVSGFSTLSEASRHSIFSTPGRDELERKKVVVEIDEGPFGRVKTMTDLTEARRRISWREKGGGRNTTEWCKCAVM